MYYEYKILENYRIFNETTMHQSTGITFFTLDVMHNQTGERQSKNIMPELVTK